MRVLFRNEKKFTTLLDPRQAFAPTRIESEIRFDPLTGDSARICHFTGLLPQMPEMEALASSTQHNCPFCQPQVARVTPRFSADFLTGFDRPGSDAVHGRLQRGEASLFPNLFPYDDISAIAVMSTAHYFRSDALPVAVVADSIKLARDFFVHCAQRATDSAHQYGLLTWNYLPASGGSQIHPHMQVALSAHPGNRLTRELAAEQAFHEQHGACYADALLAAERGGPRWLLQDAVSSWLVPYAPTGVFGDAQAYFPGKATIADLSDLDIDLFSASLIRVIAAFAALGLGSFNLTFFPQRAGASAQYHSLNARLLPRSYLNNTLHVSDASYLQLLLQESFCMRHPESVAQQLREHLRPDQ